MQYGAERKLHCLGEELWQCCATLSDNFLLIFQLEAHVIFEGNKIFRAELELWGVRSCLLCFPCSSSLRGAGLQCCEAACALHPGPGCPDTGIYSHLC